jgi:hypothetical protein
MAANDPNPFRRRRPGLVWWLWALAAVVAVVVFALLVKSCSDDAGDDGSGTGAQGSTAAIVGTTGLSGDAPGGTQAGGPGSLRAGSRDLLGLARAGGSLAAAADGGTVIGKGLRVQRRVDHTGFFVGPSASHSVFVEVEKKGLTKIKLARGDTVSFTGTLERNLEAETYGLRAGQGAEQFRAQRYHVKTQADQLSVQ